LLVALCDYWGMIRVNPSGRRCSLVRIIYRCSAERGNLHMPSSFRSFIIRWFAHSSLLHMPAAHLPLHDRARQLPSIPVCLTSAVATFCLVPEAPLSRIIVTHALFFVHDEHGGTKQEPSDSLPILWLSQLLTLSPLAPPGTTNKSRIQVLLFA